MSLAYRSKVVTAHGGHKAAMCLLCIHTCVSNETLPPHSPSLPLPSPPSIQLQPTHMFSIFQLQQEGHHLGGLFRCPSDQGGSGGAGYGGTPLWVCAAKWVTPAKWRDNYQPCLKPRLNWIILLDSGWLSILLCGRHMEWKAVNVSLAVGLSR